MNKKMTPFIIGLPNMGVGMLWAINMVLMPQLVATVTDSNAKMAALISMGAFTGIFVQWIAGVLSDRSNARIGRRKIFILGGILASTIFICMTPFATSYGVMFVLAFLFYFSLNFYQGPYYSMIPEVVENKHLGLANGFSKFISVGGSAVIFILGPSLWASNHKLPFFVAAALSLTTVLIGMVFVKETNTPYIKPTRKSVEKKSWIEAIKKYMVFFKQYPSVTKLFASIFVIYLGYGCITPFFVKYCVKVLGLTDSTASFGLLLLTVVGAIFAAPIGILSDRIERKKVLFGGILIFATCLTAGIFVKSSLGMYGILSIIGIGFISIQITAYAILAEIVPPERLGEFMGIMNLFISLGQFIANNMMGLALDQFGYVIFFPVSAVLMFAAAGLIGTSKMVKYQSQG